MRLARPSAPGAGLLGLALILAATAAVDLWAVLGDRRPGGSDTFLNQALILLESLQAGVGPGPWLEQVARQCPKGPLAPLLAMPLMGLTGLDLAGARLLSLLCHLLMVLQAAALARRLQPGARLWGALLCAAIPFVAGWSRLAYHEPLIACLLLGCLQVMTAPGDAGGRRGAVMGLLLGLGVLTKLSFLVYALVPGTWLLTRPLAAGRRGAGALAAGAVAGGALALPYLIFNRDQVAANLAMSTGAMQDMPALQRLVHISRLPGLAMLLAAGLAGAVLLVARRHSAAGWRGAGWLAAAMVLPFCLHLLWFNYWSRYLLPLAVLCAAPAGALAAAALHWVAPLRVRRAAAALLALALVALAAWHTTRDHDLPFPREQAAGMLSPVRGPHDGLARAGRALAAAGARWHVLLPDSELANARLEGRSKLLARRGSMPQPVDWPEALKRSRQAGEPLYAVAALAFLGEAERPTPARVRRLWARAPREEEMARIQRGFLAVMNHPGRQVLFTTRDADGLRYLALKLPPVAR